MSEVRSIVINPVDVRVDDMREQSHIVNPMKVQPPWYQTKRKVQVFCEITYDPKKGTLSISGVVGPMASGNCVGSCGQIDMDFEKTYEDREFTYGWDQIKWEQFLRIWKRWHLNDLKPACEHQRALGWGNRHLTLVTYTLSREASRRKNAIEDKAMAILKETGEVRLDPEDQRILALRYEITVPDNVTPEPEYEFKKKEVKTSGWVKPEEHPDGVLCKPCPVCGYRYGTKWLTEEVPQDVIDWLFSLPETLIKPAWV